MITGASSGIGRSLAVKLAEKGAIIVIASRRKGKLEEFSQELAKRSYRHLVCVADVTHRDQVERMIDSAMEKFGHLDIVINSAGAAIYGPIAATDVAQVKYYFDLNVFGAVYAIQKVYPIMARAGKGLIVNISSTAGFKSWPNNGFYCAAKHALNAITDSLRLEAKKDNIDVMLVMPGTTNTDFIDNAQNLPEEVKNNPPFDMTPDEAAEQIIDAIVKNKKRVVLTAKGVILYYLNRLSPSLVDKLLEKNA